jgi:hypothetical protein
MSERRCTGKNYLRLVTGMPSKPGRKNGDFFGIFGIIVPPIPLAISLLLDG